MKRQRKVNTKYSSSSFENLDLMKLPSDRKQDKKGSKDETNKKSDKTRAYMQSNFHGKEIENKIKSVASKKIESSPSKDDLKKMLAKAQAKNESFKHFDASMQSRTTKTIQIAKKNENFENISSTTESELDKSTENDSSLTFNNMSRSINSESGEETTNIEKNNNKEEKSELLSLKNAGNEKNKSLIDNSVETDVQDPDLYGKDWKKEPMVQLISKVYCKKSVFDSVKSLCSQASHVVRRLIPGVFKPSGYMQTTLTGQASRAHKGEGKLAPVKALNDTAKNEIIDFALKMAAQKQWTRNGIPQTREDLKRVMSQRIGELKRQIDINNKKQALLLIRD